MSPLQRLIHQGTYLLCPILLFLIGAYRLFETVAPMQWRQALYQNCIYYTDNNSGFSQISAWGWTLLLVLLPILALLLYLQRLCTSNMLILKTDSGQPLKIRETAVNRYLHDRLLAMPYIKSARVHSSAKSGSLALKIRVWITSQRPLNNIQELILSKITEDARKGFGISRILPPDLQFEAVQANGRDSEPVPPETETSEYVIAEALPASSTAVSGSDYSPDPRKKEELAQESAEDQPPATGSRWGN